MRTRPPTTQGPGFMSRATVMSASTAHTITPAMLTARSRRTRNGCRNLNGAKLATASTATAAALKFKFLHPFRVRRLQELERMQELERRKARHREHGDRGGVEPRRQLEDEQVERSRIP